MTKLILGMGLLLAAALTTAFSCVLDVHDGYAVHAFDFDGADLEKAFPHVEVSEQTWDAAGLSALAVHNTLGHVRVAAWNETRVALTLTVRAKTQRALEEVEVELTQTPGRLAWRTRHPDAHRARWTVEYVLSVPAQMDVEVKLGAGHLEVAGLAGAIDVDLGAGEVELVDLDGALTLDVGAGEATVSGFAGPSLDVDMGVGELSVAARAGAAFEVVNVDLGTGEATLSGLRARRVSLDVGTGSLNIGLPPEADYRVELEVGIGDIDVEGFDGLTRPRDRFMGERAEGVLGAGGGALEARVGMGEIRLYAAPSLAQTVAR